MNIEAVGEVFEDNFSRRGEIGASVSVWHDGREVLSLGQGFRDREKQGEQWTAVTAVLVWSATKGLAAACALHVLGEEGMSLDDRVAEVWPEFAAAGKASITFGQMFSHRAGLSALSRPVPVFDYGAVIQALEEQEPQWLLGDGHGYHPRTFGFLLDEIVRRVAGVPLGRYWQDEFAEPLGLDFWIGVPPDQLGRVAPILAARVAPMEDDFLRAFADPTSLTNRSFASPKGLHSASSMNTPEARMASFPAFGGIGTAQALGKFYAMLANGGTLWDFRYFSPETIDWMTTTLASGPDRVLCVETAYSAGFMQDPCDRDGRKLRNLFGPSPRAFGHAGAGGSVAFADPDNGIAFAYVMNQMEPGVLPNARARAMIHALYG